MTVERASEVASSRSNVRIIRRVIDSAVTVKRWKRQLADNLLFLRFVVKDFKRYIITLYSIPYKVFGKKASSSY